MSKKAEYYSKQQVLILMGYAFQTGKEGVSDEQGRQDCLDHLNKYFTPILIGEPIKSNDDEDKYYDGRMGHDPTYG